MLGPPASAATNSTSESTPSSSARPSRLRGLSYLRTYTHNHLHSHGHRAESQPLARSTSSPGTETTSATLSSTAPPLPQAGGGSSTAMQSHEHGWIPTIQGRSGLSREGAHPHLTSTFLPAESSEPTNSVFSGAARSRAASALTPASIDLVEPAPAATMSPLPPAPASLSTELPSAPNETAAPPLTIRFSPHVELRSTRPSLHFTAISRTLSSPNGVVRVGRYSERDHKAAGDTSTSPVGFKSKVVSRRHCEFWHNSGQWYVKDVKSSSGTFLNHVRLSSPGVESRPFPVNDGDVVQLGIDFKGGEDDIYRCVKIRVECNRTWQKSANAFNTSAHKKLLQNALRTGAKRNSDAGSINNSECTICFNAVAPLQALFVAPCGHVWHYKCIRQILVGPHYPNFPCPNCRLVADLEAEIDQSEPSGDDDEAEAEGDLSEPPQSNIDNLSTAESQRAGSSSAQPQRNTDSFAPLINNSGWSDADLAHALAATTLHTSEPSIPVAEVRLGTPGTDSDTRSLVSSPLGNSHLPETASRPIYVNGTSTISHPEGPMTPRNDVGPFILDGGGINGSSGEGGSESDTSGAQTRAR